MRDYVNPPYDVMEVCPRQRDESLFRRRIFQLMDETVDMIRQNLEKLKEDYPPLEKLQFDNVRAHNFSQQVEIVYQTSTRWPEKHRERRPYILCVIEFLRVSDLSRQYS